MNYFDLHDFDSVWTSLSTLDRSRLVAMVVERIDFNPNDDGLSGTISSEAVPEPSTAIAMGLLGIVGFAANRRRRTVA